MGKKQTYQCCIVAARTLSLAVILTGLLRYLGFLSFPFDHDVWLNSAGALFAFYGYGLFVLLPVAHRGRVEFALVTLAGTILCISSFWIMFQLVLQPIGAHYQWPMRWSFVAGLFVTLYYSYIPCQILLRRQRRLDKREG